MPSQARVTVVEAASVAKANRYRDPAWCLSMVSTSLRRAVRNWEVIVLNLRTPRPLSRIVTENWCGVGGESRRD